jgi:hypothetical protein
MSHDLCNRSDGTDSAVFRPRYRPQAQRQERRDQRFREWSDDELNWSITCSMSCGPSMRCPTQRRWGSAGRPRTAVASGELPVRRRGGRVSPRVELDTHELRLRPVPRNDKTCRQPRRAR